ncbi:aldo/keto reductase [Microvirga sp. BT688]|uniref:aldo/keto reductase n=1 Tax=Microvirga sp. TaxID=1873136 RepID=UPI001688DE23|nr:aldo/keto reductase [Microvirga sp.]MBD2750173.1 aldo/keto reductase [Microvirga sp.]
MRYRPLGQTGISVSEIGIGAWQLSGPLTLDGQVGGYPDLGAKYVVDLIRRIGDLGVNFIDTAEQYGNGESERRIGQALAGRRKDWIISTKFGTFSGAGGERVDDASVKRLPISLEGSLRRLGTDYIDIYLCHISPETTELSAIARFIEDAKRRGQIRIFGISTNDLQQIRLLQSHGLCDVVQFAQNMIDPATEIATLIHEARIGGVVRGAFHGGRLSGKYFHAPPHFRPDDIRSLWFDSKTVGQTFARYRAFERLACPGRSLPQIAVRFLLDRPGTNTVIIGAKSIEEYTEAARAVDLPTLKPSDLREIDHLRRKVTGRRWLSSLKRLLKS